MKREAGADIAAGRVTRADGVDGLLDAPGRSPRPLKYEFVDSFRSDWNRLSAKEQELVRALLPTFNAACDRFAADPSYKWPTSLRVKDIEGAPGILEMTWSFSGSDGRATFEWITIDGELAVRWRRIGGHAIFKKP